MTHPHLTPVQRECLEADRRHLLRKVTDPASTRARERTAREKLAAELTALQAPRVLPQPEVDHAALAGVMR